MVTQKSPPSCKTAGLKRTVLHVEVAAQHSLQQDVYKRQGYTKASVSIAMKKLRENGYIAVDGEGNLTLLEPGREIAERIYSRHRLLTHFFVQLGVDEDVAAEDACKAEHILSEQTLKKIREYALLHDAEDSVQKSE